MHEKVSSDRLITFQLITSPSPDFDWEGQKERVICRNHSPTGRIFHHFGLFRSSENLRCRRAHR